MGNEECIDSATGQETQLAVLGTTERALYTVQSIRNVLHHDASQKEPESYGSTRKQGEAGGIHRPELDGAKWKCVEYAGSYSIVQCLGSVNPYSYPYRRVRASDLWCRRWRDVSDGPSSPRRGRTDRWHAGREVSDYENRTETRRRPKVSLQGDRGRGAFKRSVTNQRTADEARPLN